MSPTNFLYVMLVISLIFNYLILGEVQELKDDVRFLKSNSHEVDSLMQNVNDKINTTMTEFEKEQRWISPVKQETGVITGEDENIQLSWQVKDYIEGASVFFYYRLPDKEEFTELQAIPTGGGGFKVEIPVQLNFEPQWSISISHVNNHSMKTSEESGKSQSYHLQYYISVREGERIRSSEETLLSLNTGKNNLYAPLRVDVTISNDNQYNVNLSEFTKEKAKVEIKQAVLEVYKNGTLVTQKELEKQNNIKAYRHFDTTWVPEEQPFDQVMIKVEYNNGEIFQRDITGDFNS